MTDTFPDIPFIHRVVPLSTIIQRVACALIALGAAVWFWSEWVATVLLIALALVFLLMLGFTRVVTFLVDCDGLTILRQQLLRIGGSRDSFAPRDIRRIRYRSEEHYDSDREETEIHYILNMVTEDSRTVLLLQTEIISFDPKLGMKLARALGVGYEEYLAPE